MFLAHTSNHAGWHHPHHIQNLCSVMMNCYFLLTSGGKSNLSTSLSVPAYWNSFRSEHPMKPCALTLQTSTFTPSAVSSHTADEEQQSSIHSPPAVHLSPATSTSYQTSSAKQKGKKAICGKSEILHPLCLYILSTYVNWWLFMKSWLLWYDHKIAIN